VGGEKSGWCIGAMRRPQNCGDSYLDWTQIREMTKTGLIEIGAHTINHANLAGLSPADQTREIVDSKTIIENELGVKITTLAYPYGRYSQATIDIAFKAGFKSAVTTASGLSQSSANRLTLMRVRDALLLP
ncbi:MAG: polysaccharide deacetylase family protein, partial [Patescibacteria group bacterium]|nr:polysaccharide deacetylase family protein [Patescibacteria group bacterium]